MPRNAPRAAAAGYLLPLLPVLVCQALNGFFFPPPSSSESDVFLPWHLYFLLNEPSVLLVFHSGVAELLKPTTQQYLRHRHRPGGS